MHIVFLRASWVISLLTEAKERVYVTMKCFHSVDLDIIRSSMIIHVVYIYLICDVETYLYVFVVTINYTLCFSFMNY